ncbi:hypothetical protein FNV43_RR00677 [Rhamnella rubrinervis]|uniref:Glycine-rich protein n=1 Tax=Rhamnella rubrinervis TaxID=2594499 RepID=A0A8K0MS66_9ROSA|nr:hypothetical protein FNV43_RR00677 [Rhamnella rubrinervis]
MGSKAFLFLGLLLAIVLLISSEVSARDLAETSPDNKNVDAIGKPDGVSETQYGGYPGGGYNGGRGGYNGGSPRHGGGGGSCYYGCCRRSYYGRGCSRCCSYAGEAVDAEPEAAKPHN